MAKDKDGNWIPDWPMCDKCNYRHLEKVTCEENAERKRQQRAKGKPRGNRKPNPNLDAPAARKPTPRKPFVTGEPDPTQSADGGTLSIPDPVIGGGGVPVEEAWEIAERERIAAQAKRDAEAWAEIQAATKKPTPPKKEKAEIYDSSGRLRCSCSHFRDTAMCEHVEDYIIAVLDHGFDTNMGLAVVPLFDAPVYVPSIGNIVPEVHVHVGPEDENHVRMVRLVPSDRPWGGAETAFPVIGMITQVDGRRAVRNMVLDKLKAIQAADDGPITCSSEVHDPNLVFPVGLASELYDTYCRAYNQTCLRCTLVTTAIGVDA